MKSAPRICRVCGLRSTELQCPSCGARTIESKLGAPQASQASVLHTQDVPIDGLHKETSLGFAGTLAVILALLYAVWAGALAVLVEGQVVSNAISLRGVDMTSAREVLEAMQDPGLNAEVATLRVESKSYWFTVRHASMSVLSLLVAIALLRRWGTARHWLALLAMAIPTSMFLAFAVAPHAGAADVIGVSTGCILGGLVWGALWWQHGRHLRAHRCMQTVSGGWWLRSATGFVGLSLLAVFLLGATLKGKAEKAALGAADSKTANGQSGSVEHPAGWVVHTPSSNDRRQPAISLASPASWVLGEPGLAGSVFIALPPNLPSGNVVVRVVPFPPNIDVWQETSESFRAGFLQASQLVYRDMTITAFSKGHLATMQRCVDLTYSAKTVAGTVVHGQMRFASCSDFLVTLHVEARTIPPSVSNDIERVAASLRLSCQK